MSTDVIQIIFKYRGYMMPTKVFSTGIGHTGHDNNDMLYDSNNYKWSPLRFFDKMQIIDIACSLSHSLFLDNTGNVYQCKDGTPKMLYYFNESKTRIRKICCNFKTSLAIDIKGIVWFWGILHECPWFNKERPQIIETIKDYNIVDIKAGLNNWYAKSSTYNHWLWGDNSYGQVKLQKREKIKNIDKISEPFLINDIFYKKTKCRIKDVYFGLKNKIYAIGVK